MRAQSTRRRGVANQLEGCIITNAAVALQEQDARHLRETEVLGIGRAVGQDVAPGLHAKLVPVVVPVVAAAQFIPDRKPPAALEIELVATEPAVDAILIDDDVDLVSVLLEGPVFGTRFKLGVGRCDRSRLR